MLDLIDDDCRAALLTAGTQKTLAADEYLVHEGAPSDAVFIILEGLLKITKTSPEGRVTFVGLRGPGTMAGELGVLDPAPRSTALVAIEPTTLRRISMDAFFQVLAQRPELNMALLRDLSVRLRHASNQIHFLANADALTRTAARLLALSEDRLPERERNRSLPTIDLPVSQRELGEWVGLSRAAVAKALRELRNVGAIETSRLSFTITDIEALRAAAAS